MERPRDGHRGGGRVTQLPAAAFGGGLLLLAAVALAFSLRHATRGARLAAADPYTSASEPGDFVRASGAVVTTDERLRAPFTGRNCVAVRFDVEERRVGSYYLPSWERIGGGTANTGFEVRADGRRITVGDDPSTVSLGRSASVTVPRDEDPPAEIREYLGAADGVATDAVNPPKPLAGPFSFGDRRYRERRLDPGDHVTVFGRIAGATDPDRRLDPVVVSDASPAETAFRIARQSTAGLAIGAVSGLVGLTVLLV